MESPECCTADMRGLGHNIMRGGAAQRKHLHKGTRWESHSRSRMGGGIFLSYLDPSNLVSSM